MANPFLLVLISLSLAVVGCKDQKTAGSAVPQEDTGLTMSERFPTPPFSTLVIRYRTLMTTKIPDQDEMKIEGEEVRTFDIANNKARYEKYQFVDSKKELIELLITDASGSTRVSLTDNEGVFSGLTAGQPAWTYNATMNGRFAEDMGATVDSGQWLERPCEIVSIPGIKEWLWHKIPLRHESDMTVSTLMLEAIAIEENAPVDPSLLEVPPGIKIKSVNQPG